MRAFVNIYQANVEDIPTIVDLAFRTWFVTYKDIISEEQINFMFGEIYTPDSLYKQMTFLQHQFLILYEGQVPVAYASYSKLPDVSDTHKLHKVYVLPDKQGKKYGAELIKKVEENAKKEGSRFLQLNVNRNNKAKGFYERLGYKVIEIQDISIGEFWMNDYLMQTDLY